jgi:hypothetical protein
MTKAWMTYLSLLTESAGRDYRVAIKGGSHPAAIIAAPRHILDGAGALKAPIVCFNASDSCGLLAQYMPFLARAAVHNSMLGRAVVGPGSLKKAITLPDIFRWRGLYAPSHDHCAGTMVACTAWVIALKRQHRGNREDVMSEAKCPFHHTAGTGTSNRDWWPNQLKLDSLHQHSSGLRDIGARSSHPHTVPGAVSVAG